MSSTSNLGVIYYANGNASGGAVQLNASGGAGTNQVSAGTTLSLGQRIAVTVGFGFANVTKYTVQIQVLNGGLFLGNVASGTQAPDPSLAFGASGPPKISGTWIPLLSVAQNDDAGGGQPALNHDYSTQAIDLIQLPHPVTGGSLRVSLTSVGTQPNASSDYFVALLDCY